MNASTLWPGKIAVVTGGGIGIGKAYSKGFAARGATTVIADIDRDAAKETAAEIQREGGDAIAIPTDVGEEDSVRSLFRTVAEQYGILNFLVNNAAIMLRLHQPFKPFWETSIKEWDRIFRVNTASVFLAANTRSR